MGKDRKKKKAKQVNEEKLTLALFRDGIGVMRAKISQMYARISRNIWNYMELISNRDKSAIIFTYVGLLLFFEIFVVLLSIFSFWALRSTVLTVPVWLSVIFAIVPFGMWVWSTTLDYWCYHERKRGFFNLCYVNVYMLIMLYIYRTVYGLIIPFVDSVPYSLFMDTEGHRLLATGLMFYSCLWLGLIVGYAFFRKDSIAMSILLDSIDRFKIGHYMDFRENKENLYDFTILNDLSNGKDISVKENDRFTGTVVNGQSGTGKTSTIFTTSIGEDLQKKLINTEKLKAALHEMVLAGKLKLKEGIDEPIAACGEFDARAFEAVGEGEELKENQKEYKKYLETFPNCGITAIAPNDGLTGDVIKLCGKLGLKVNVIDPMPDEKTGRYKENYTGINPFFVNPDISEVDKIEDISNKATIFADIMAAINDEAGTTDGYFADINKAVTINVGIVNMVSIPKLLGRQANIFDMQESFNDFDTLTERIKFMENEYGEVVVKQPVSKNKRRGQRADEVADNLSAVIDATSSVDEIVTSEGEVSDIVADFDGKAAKKELEKGNNPYLSVIQFVKKELLGAGREKMEDQSRGLRNQINNFLINPHINRVFSYTERILDFDRIFRDGEVTVVNTALQLGDSQSKAFGLYFILLFRQAMFRRPMATRVCRHWCYIDELPVYLHPRLEAIYSLARQYRCGFYSAIQTLDQMEKNSTTKYLRGVLMGAGTHIIFGRVNSSEMKLYSELAGMKLEEHVKYGASKSSILEDSGNYTSSEQREYVRANVLDGYDIRNRDFAEVTFFTSDNGNVLEVKSAKAHFIDMSKFENIERAQYKWGSGATAKHFFEAYFVKEEEIEDAAFEENVIITPDNLEGDMVIGVSTEMESVMPEPVVSGPYIQEPVISQMEASSDNEEMYEIGVDEDEDMIEVIEEDVTENGGFGDEEDEMLSVPEESASDILKRFYGQ